MKTKFILFIVLALFCVVAPAAAGNGSGPITSNMALPAIFAPMLLGNSTTPQPLAVYATMESIGIVSPYLGDDDEDSTAVAWYRPTGTSTWLEAHRLSVDTINREWRGSIVYLEASTSYDLEVRYTDPDGVSPSTVSASIQTRPDYPDIGGGGIIRTVSSDDDLQGVIDDALPGDTIRLTAGVYHADVKMQADDSGAAGQYITIEPAPGANVIFDGSDPDVNGSGNNWTYYASSAAGPIYYTDLAWGDTACDDNLMVPQYAGELRSGEGWRYQFFDSGSDTWDGRFMPEPAGKAYYVCNDDGPGPRGRLYVVTYDGVDPDNVTMHVSRYQRAFRLENADYYRIRNFEFRYYSQMAIQLTEDGSSGSDFNIVEGNTFHGNGEWGIRLSGSSNDEYVTNTLVQDNVFYEHGYRDSEWVWDIYYHDGRGDATFVSLYETGPGTIIRRNTFTSGHDAINVNQKSDEVDVYENTITECMDNGIEIDDNAGQNIRVWDNTITDCYASISAQGWDNNDPGPAYFFRNVIVGGEDPLGRAAYDGDTQGYASGFAFKLGSENKPDGELFIYHNTVSLIRDSMGQGDGLNDSGGDYFANATVYNNIWNVTGKVYKLDDSRSVSDHDFDCNNVHDLDPVNSTLIWWSNSGGPTGDGKYKNLADFQSYQGQELNSISDIGTLFDAAMRLLPGSPDIDAGCVVIGFNDRGPVAYAGPAPDLGAFESGVTGCVPGVISRSLSSVLALIPQVTADGLETASVTATVKDECGNNLTGIAVTLASSRGSTDTITPALAVTNAQGQATFTVKSTKTSDFIGGAYVPSVLTATAGVAFVLDQTAGVAFDCFSGIALSSTTDSIRLQLTNDTPATRRLIRATVTWPAGSGRELIELWFTSDLIWDGSKTSSPITISSGWNTPGNMRDVTAGSSETLEVVFDYTLSSVPSTYVVSSRWKDPINGNSMCSSNSVSIPVP